MNNTIQAEKQQAAIDLHSRIDSSFANHASKTNPGRVNIVPVNNSIQTIAERIRSVLEEM